MIIHRAIGALVIAMLAGCAINPSTGRSQLIALPAMQAAQADMNFAVAAAMQNLGSIASCDRSGDGDKTETSSGTSCPSDEQLTKFEQQVKRVSAELEPEAHRFAPGLIDRIGAFDVRVEPGIGNGTASNAGGQIALAPGLAALDPTDDVVAFLIAREMGHVIARHGEENAGAQMVFSALVAIVPVGGMVAKLAASMAGSSALKSSWAADQLREADEIALSLLDRSHRSPDAIALNLHAGIDPEQLPQGEWGANFAKSVKRVGAIALAYRRSAQYIAANEKSKGPRPSLVVASLAKRIH